MRRAQTHERRHKINAARIGHRSRQFPALRRGRDDSQLVAQPLDRRPRNENAPFHRELRPARATPRASPAAYSSTPAAALPYASARNIPFHTCSSKAPAGSKPARTTPPADPPRFPQSESPLPSAPPPPLPPRSSTEQSSAASPAARQMYPATPRPTRPDARSISMVRDAFE